MTEKIIFEKWNTHFNIEELKNYLESQVLPLSPICQSSSFGGWSVLSSNGSYKDGWHRGFIGISNNMSLHELNNKVAQSGGNKSAAYVVPTEICTGYMKVVIDFIQSKNLAPSRARIIRLPAGGACVWHRDAPDNIYCVRLHIPIITNSECYFEVEGGRAHLKADGSAYFLPVNRMHRVVNEGETDRFHLVITVRDYDGITQNCRLPRDLESSPILS